MTERPSDQDVDTAALTSGTNPRGIPQAAFIDDVATFLAKLGAGTEVAIGAFNELYSKYKLMETSLERNRANTRAKVPDIERSLDLLKLLMQKQEDQETVRMHYNLADTVHAQAQLDCDGTVCIWLGANVMVEYSYSEALALLQKSLAVAQEKTRTLTEDLEFLRTNSITVEVNLARIFNWDVKRRREAKAQEGT